MKCTLILEAENSQDLQMLLRRLNLVGGDQEPAPAVSASTAPEIKPAMNVEVIKTSIPVENTSSHVCRICGAPLTEKRSKICGSKACKKIAAREYARAYAAQKKVVVMPAAPEDPLAVENPS